MSRAVIDGISYVLAQTPHILKAGGTTLLQAEENEDEKFLNLVDDHLRSFQDCVKYPPNQAYIGNILPEDLKEINKPWYQEESLIDESRYSSFGEIMPEDEFFGLMQYSDVFDLVFLTSDFKEHVEEKLSNHPLWGEENLELSASDSNKIEELVEEDRAIPLYWQDNMVGCVKEAHASDINLSAHVMLENLATKASGVLALKNLQKDGNIDFQQVDYIIECSEEACGDMNQRGGGNFAKAIGEIVGCDNATGSDVRGFCAAPSHALVQAAALVEADIYNKVAVVGGGAVAKLGMNAKNHIEEGMPILEDTLGGFAFTVSSDDGESPVMRTDILGRHTIGKGASPQAVISALVTDALDRADLSLNDVDKYSVEMQNPEITEPAGAGNVPESNYKMIAALGVKRGEIEKANMMNFVEEHGMPGFAPTQGHIPSGVPFIGPAAEMMKNDKLKRALIIGKGSLFLGRMTNQFDGISFIMEKNDGKVEAEKEKIDKEEIRSLIAESMKGLAEQLEGKEDK